MPKVAVVTDSTASIPARELAACQCKIEILPLRVIFGAETLRDGVDISPTEFYKRLKSSKENPTTSQPSPEEFKAVYQRLHDEGYDVISMHISGKLSGTIDSATQAKNMLPGYKIELVDSQSTAMALGFSVLQIARAAANGASLEDCRMIAERAKSHIGALFVVSTLEYLHRGGRIGGATAFLGTALGMKPLLELTGGRVEPIERIRTISRATDRLFELLDQRIGSQSPVRLSAVHADAPAAAASIMERARERFHPDELVDSEISPVLGTHTGPGTFGFAFMIGM